MPEVRGKRATKLLVSNSWEVKVLETFGTAAEFFGRNYKTIKDAINEGTLLKAKNGNLYFIDYLLEKKE